MQASSNWRGAWIFGAVLLALLAAELLLGFVSVPLGLVYPLSLLVTVIFVAAPICGLYLAASAPWTPKLALACLIGGVAVHQGLQFLLHPVHSASAAFGMAVLSGLSQSGLLVWCLGLGALLATLLKDRNLLLPVALFLAAFDVFMVLTPIGITQRILKEHPELFQRAAYSVPRVMTHVTRGPVGVAARIGPADIFFLGMFFIALYRFNMRTRETFYAVVPTLIGYLAIVLLFGNAHIGRVSLGMLPALLPIGTVVILVNRKEFKMTGEEKLSTAVIALIGIGLIAFGATRKPAPPAEDVPPTRQSPSNTAPTSPSSGRPLKLRSAPSNSGFDKAP